MKRACKECKLLVETGVCPICKNSDFSTSWNGRVTIIDVENSQIAKKMAVKANGDFAIKVR